jgi:hypothetical protein
MGGLEKNRKKTGKSLKHPLKQGSSSLTNPPVLQRPGDFRFLSAIGRRFLLPKVDGFFFFGNPFSGKGRMPIFQYVK